MVTEKGKALGARWLLGIGLSALAAGSRSDAAIVTLSGVFTNTSGVAVEKEFSYKITVTENIAKVGTFGSLSLVVTDFNRNGASLTSSAGQLYSGLINGTAVKSFVPETVPGGGFVLNAAARSLATYDTKFGSLAAPEPIIGSLKANDEIEVRLKFIVSAGDQVAYTATMNLVDLTAVPGPGAAALALLTPWVPMCRRRRAENDSGTTKLGHGACTAPRRI